MNTLRSRLIPFICCSVLAAFLVSAFVPPVRAQNWNSNLEGVILDPTSAVVPGATVILHKSATGLTRSTVSSEKGFYSFPLLPVGTYELEVSKTGFAAKTLSGLVLQVGQTARVDVTLELPRGETVVL